MSDFMKYLKVARDVIAVLKKHNININLAQIVGIAADIQPIVDDLGATIPAPIADALALLKELGA